MPPYIQPSSLLDLSFAAVRLALLDFCHQLHENKMAPSRQLRQQWQQLLPTALRQQLLLRTNDCGAAAGNGDGTLGYYMVGLLLGPDISQLRLELCCYYGCSHQAALLKLLASSQGKSITRLQLSRSALLRLDQCLLQSVLLNAENLQQLTMRNIATDATLSAIGSSCKNLVQLDVSNSRQISDQGIKQLFLQIELRNKTDRTNRNNYAVSITTTRRSNFIDKTVRRLHQTFAQCLGTANERSGSNSCRDFLLECFERQTALCDKLQVLNLTNTGVTSIGILIALENCTNLQSVGDYAHIHQALELLEMREKRSAQLQLVSARNTLTTHKTLQLIYRMCPQLQHLSVMDTRFTPGQLMHMATPASLTSLTLLVVPATTAWISQFYAYVATHTPHLTQLTLVFGALVNLELAQLLQACSALQTLVIDGANITYNPQTPPMPSHKLEKLQLGQNVCSAVVVSLLAHCPRLTIAHFYNCPDLRQLTAVASHTLQCFYIYQARLADIGQAIVTVLANCPQLEHLGHLANWTGGSLLRHHTTATAVINNISATNYKLQFEPGAHWYHSKCIKNYE